MKILDKEQFGYIKEKSPHENHAFKKRLCEKSYFQSKFNSGMTLEIYDKNEFPFSQLTIKCLRTMVNKDELPYPLNESHKMFSENQMRLDSSGVSLISKEFYSFEEEFSDVYYSFLKNVLEKEIFKEPLVFQKIPTFRFSFPSSPGFTWKPNYHTDIMLGHPPEEINIWLPLTSCYATNSFRCSSLKDSMETYKNFDYDLPKFASMIEEDFIQKYCENITESISMDDGQYLLFDSRSLHVHQKNLTDTTRISIDFRVIPFSVYEKMPKNYVGTGRLKKRFIQGDYYDIKNSSEI